MQLELLNDQGQAASKIDAPEAPVPRKTVSRFATRPRSLSSKKAPAAHAPV